MNAAPNEEQLGVLRSAIEEFSRDAEQWPRFKDEPEAVLAERDVALPPDVAIRFHHSPLGYDALPVAQIVRCPPGYDAQLTSEWTCVCTELVEIVVLVPTGETRPGPGGIRIPVIEERVFGVFCLAHEWQQVPVWTCVRSVKAICGAWVL